MFILFIVWAIIAGTALFFSKEEPIFWQRILAVEVSQSLLAVAFNVSLVIVLVLSVSSFVIFPLGDAVLFMTIFILWCGILKLVSMLISKQ